MRRKFDRKDVFRPYVQKKIFHEVYDQLLSLIVNGKLKPGDQLPPERILAEQLGVSRQTIREGLKKAETKGLIKVRQGEGTFILSGTSELIENPFIAMMEKEVDKVYEFLEIRELIEGWCARRAAEQAKVKDLRKMEKALSEMAKLIDTNEVLGQPDVDFHVAIAEASHNTLMVHLMASIRQIHHSMFKISQGNKQPGKNRILIKQHQEIYEAIKGRNPKLAQKKIERHLHFLENEWKEESGRYRQKKSGIGL